MKISTINFDKIEIVEDKIILFEEGLPAFEDEKQFVIILNEDEDNPFHFLQSINTPELSFVILNPFEIFKDYDILLPEIAISKLKVKNEEDVLIYTMVIIPEDMTKMTTNLLGPIVINQKQKLGKQVILEENKYSTKEPIFKDSELGGE